MKNNINKSSLKPRYLNRKQVSKPSTSASTPVHDDFFESDPSEIQRRHEILSSLPSGYTFKPTDVEIVNYYLRRKIANQPLPPVLIHPVNLYRHHPRTLDERYLKHPDGDEVFYFSPRDRKYKNGSRPNRAVLNIGYWKPTVKDFGIKIGKEIIGFKKTLVFYEGKHPFGTKTSWIMHEYRIPETKEKTSMKLDDWVLCKIRDNSKNEKNKKANSNTSDAETENAPVNAIVVGEEDKRLNTGHCGTYPNQLTEEGNWGNTGCGTSYNTGYASEENLGNTGSGTSYHTSYASEDNLGNTGSGTSYNNDVYQSHEDMGPVFVHGPPFQFDTRQDNYNMITYNNPTLNETPILYDDGFNIRPMPLGDSYNYQGSSSDENDDITN